MLDPFFDSKIEFDIFLEVLEASSSMNNHVQCLISSAFFKPIPEDVAFAFCEYVASHPNRFNLSVAVSIKYDLSVIDMCRVGVSEGEAKNSARIRTEKEIYEDY